MCSTVETSCYSSSDQKRNGFMFFSLVSNSHRSVVSAVKIAKHPSRHGPEPNNEEVTYTGF